MEVPQQRSASETRQVLHEFALSEERQVLPWRFKLRISDPLLFLAVILFTTFSSVVTHVYFFFFCVCVCLLSSFAKVQTCCHTEGRMN